jgi:hypothetical protein
MLPAAALQEQLIAVAMERARELLSEQGLPLPESTASQQLHGAPVDRRPFFTTLRIEVEGVALRAAFTHIPLWLAAMQEVQLVQEHMTKGPGMFPIARHMLTPTQYEVVKAAAPLAETEWHFRRRLQVKQEL